MDASKYFAKNHKDLRGWIGYKMTLDPYSYFLTKLLGPKKDKLVLDDGSGNGRFSVAMAKEGARVVALDINKLILKTAKKWTKQGKLSDLIDFVQGDIQNLPFKGDVFDKVLCAHNLWCIPNYKAAVAEMFRTLKSGGRVVTDHLNLLNWRVLRAECLNILGKILRQNPTPVFYRTPKQILQPFATFRTEIFSLTSPKKTIVNRGKKRSAPRLIIRGSK